MGDAEKVRLAEVKRQAYNGFDINLTHRLSSSRASANAVVIAACRVVCITLPNASC